MKNCQSNFKLAFDNDPCDMQYFLQNPYKGLGQKAMVTTKNYIYAVTTALS